MITQFKKQYAFLSNFAPCTIKMRGVTYGSVEAAFQAAKTTDPKVRATFQGVDGNTARQMGRDIALRPDWEEIKISVMRAALKQKFKPGSELAQKLLDTEGMLLIDGNFWNETFWGFSLQKGYGENWLGRLLMERRAELAELAKTQPQPEPQQQPLFPATVPQSTDLTPPWL